MSGQREFTVVHVPNGTLTRLCVSEKLIQMLAAEYGGTGWRVCRMGDVLVLHSKEQQSETMQSSVPELEREGLVAADSGTEVAR